MSNDRRPTVNDVRVSDHALLRFLERAGGLEVEALRALIEESLARAVNTAAQIGATDFEIRADGLRYIVRLNAVVTVLVDRGPRPGAVPAIKGA